MQDDHTSNKSYTKYVVILIFSFFFQVELEGLTGEIRFSEQGRRQNYSLQVVEMTVNSAMVKIAQWSDEHGLQLGVPKYSRPKTFNEFEKNRTYIVTTILVSVLKFQRFN